MKMVGKQVAAGRTAKNLTQQQLADLVRLDVETIASIEQGRRALMPNIAELMDLHLCLPGLLAVAAHEMPERDAAPPWSEEYMDLERRAVAFSWYECAVVPGMLQTESYMRALFGGRVPSHPPETIERLTLDRLARTKILWRKAPPSLSFILWEAALRDQIGGADVYAEQLRHLLACMDLPHVTLQILPFGRTQYASHAGSFTVLETPEHTFLGYSEGQRHSKLFSDPEYVSILAQRYGMLRTQALNTEQTKGLLNHLLGEL
ncbi:helix-turn-helix domain-containing protein [Streptomyces xanthophaeus]